MSLLYIHDLLKTAFKLLLANKRRSLMTMLGIIIGVSSVIIIMAIGTGAQSLILGQIKGLGSNLVGVLPGKSEANSPPAQVFGIAITTLVNDDLTAISNKSRVPNILAAVGYSRGLGNVSWNGTDYETTLNGVSSAYLDVEGGEVISGRFFSADEDKSLARVVVLGDTVKTELFGDQDPLNKRVKIKNNFYEVIGVMKKRGQVAFQDYDDMVLLPLETAQKLVNGVSYLSFMRAKVDNEANIDLAVNDIKQTLREQHHIIDSTGGSDDFDVRNAAAALDALKTVTDALRYFLAAMAALSLLVGGIGIMNIMLIRVSERTREIGLRKAVGAKRRDIMNQFLAESITITLTGGVIGIIIGEGVSLLIALVVRGLGYPWDFGISALSILLSTTISITIGLIFGLYPASKASKLEPVEALRYE